MSNYAHRNRCGKAFDRQQIFELNFYPLTRNNSVVIRNPLRGGESLFERGWVMENLCLSRISGRNWDMEKRFSYIFTSVLLSLGYMSYFVSRARTTICFKCIFLASTNKQWINKSSLWNKYFTSLLRILELIYVQSYCRITVRLLYD